VTRRQIWRNPEDFVPRETDDKIAASADYGRQESSNCRTICIHGILIWHTSAVTAATAWEFCRYGLFVLWFKPVCSADTAVLPCIEFSDRTDLSTESGSGPIQLAQARYQTACRSVADSPSHCTNAPQCTLQAKKRGKISEKWEYTVEMWNNVWLTSFTNSSIGYRSP